MMSKIAPRVQRTSLVSAAGGILEVHAAERAALDVEGDVRLGDHRLQSVLRELVLAKGRAKNPRSSSRRSRSMTNAPSSFVSAKIIRLQSSALVPDP